MPLRAAGEAAARAAGGRSAAGRRDAADPGRRARDLGDAPRPRRAEGGRPVPRGPLLPAQRRVAAGCRRSPSGARTSRCSRRISCAGSPSATSEPVPTLAPDAMALLIAAPWPGNVRQLLNLLEQAVALATTSRHSRHRSSRARCARTPARWCRSRRRARPSSATTWCGCSRSPSGNVTQAALLAKRNRTEFYKLLQRHRLEPAMFKEGKAP